MIVSVTLLLLVVLSGTIATYLYDEPSPLAARVCAGACLGITALSLIGFLLALLFGLTTLTVLIAALVCSVPILLLVRTAYFERLQSDLHRASRTVQRYIARPDLLTTGYLVFYGATILLLWRVFAKAMIQDSDGISTGLLNNFGDLPFHLSVITSFAFGNNFPPEDPTYAGIRFTYPFLSDFASALFVRCGADLRQSMFI